MILRHLVPVFLVPALLMSCANEKHREQISEAKYHSVNSSRKEESKIEQKKPADCGERNALKVLAELNSLQGELREKCEKLGVGSCLPGGLMAAIVLLENELKAMGFGVILKDGHYEIIIPSALSH